MKDLFTPDDFVLFDTYSQREYAARKAYEKLSALIDASPIIYTQRVNPDMGYWPWNAKPCKGKEIKKARLMFIEEIVKEPCKHNASWTKLKTSMSVDVFDNRYAHVDSVCIECGAKLTANWIEKNE